MKIGTEDFNIRMGQPNIDSVFGFLLSSCLELRSLQTCFLKNSSCSLLVQFPSIHQRYISLFVYLIENSINYQNVSKQLQINFPGTASPETLFSVMRNMPCEIQPNHSSLTVLDKYLRLIHLDCLNAFLRFCKNQMEHSESSRISPAKLSALEVTEALKVSENLALKLWHLCDY